MIIPAFFVASMVGFHVEFSQSMYSSKCPYSTPISCTRVTGPSVYLRSSWARASKESEEAARHMDRIMVLATPISTLHNDLFMLPPLPLLTGSCGLPEILIT